MRTHTPTSEIRRTYAFVPTRYEPKAVALSCRADGRRLYPRTGILARCLGGVAEWLGRGLQIPPPWFDSARRLCLRRAVMRRQVRSRRVDPSQRRHDHE